LDLNSCSVIVGGMAAQLPLLGSGRPQVDPGFRGLRRIVLDEDAWVDHLPGWLTGHQALFDRLESETPWSASERTMYDDVVSVPRLTAFSDIAGARPQVLRGAAAALCRRYDRSFDRVGLSLYRDGRDSVAFHRDKVLCDMDTATVAIVSLGEPRRFLLRPFGGGRSQAFNLGWGDLLVMGGACQRTWEHGVPKSASAQARMSVVFRHS
jgi:alkylated DNA repair dioxygenase AlkB